jgi:hypothetical protein
VSNSKEVAGPSSLVVSHLDESDGFFEAHSAADDGAFCSVSDDEVVIIIHSHQNARRIGEWLIEWADTKEVRDVEAAREGGWVMKDPSSKEGWAVHAVQVARSLGGFVIIDEDSSYGKRGRRLRIACKHAVELGFMKKSGPRHRRVYTLLGPTKGTSNDH